MYTDKPIYQKLYDDLLAANRNKIEKLPEFKNCIELVKESSYYMNRKKFDDVWGKSPFKSEFDYFHSMFLEVIRSSYENNNIIDWKVFEDEYQKLRRFLCSEFTSVVQIHLPLYNLHCDRDSLQWNGLIENSGNLHLRRMTDEDKEFLISVTGGYSGDSIIAIHNSEFMFDIEYFQKFYSHSDNLYDNIMKTISYLVTALRLNKDKFVGAPFILLKAPMTDVNNMLIPFDYDLNSLLKSLLKTSGGLLKTSEKYYVKEADINNLMPLLRRLKKVTTNNSIVALDRFNLSYARKQTNDKIIDLMISYEALFGGKQTDSISHKLAWRFSKLLGNNFDTRSRLYKRMQELYRIRSRIVHGDLPTLDEKILYEIETHIRNALAKYLLVMETRTFETHNEFLDYLDFDYLA